MEKKSGLGVSLGYGLGSMVRVGENLWGFYLSYFLVTVVGINAAVAGSISSAALLIASIACIFIGYLSDNSRSKNGKRRPIMLASIFPCAILMTLIFVNVGTGTGATIYYAIICIVFYLVYYTFLVPYDSLGAELTVDYNSRTRIRTICTIILYVSVFVGGTLVMMVQIAFQGAGIGGASSSWTIAVALICSLPMLICGLIAWRVTKGKEPLPDKDAPPAKKENIFKSYLSVLKLKPFVGIALWSLIYFTGNTLLAGALVYYGVYGLGISEAAASSYFTISMVTTIVAAIPGNFLAAKIGKKNTLLFAMVFFTVIALIVMFKDPGGYFDGALLSVAYGVTNSIALICSYAMVYDIGELSEFVMGENKTAACVGTYTLGMGIAQAIGYALVGYILEFSGFNPEAAAQPEGVTKMLLYSETLFPLILMLLSGLIILLLYKINSKNFGALVTALEAKREGKEYSTEGFKELL